MNIMERGYQVLQEALQANTQHWPRLAIIQNIFNVLDSEKRRQERYNDPVENRKTLLPSANLGRYHHHIGAVPMHIIRNPSQRSMGLQLQGHYHISYDNKDTEVRRALMRIGPSWVQTQKRSHPLTPIRIYHGDIPIPDIPRKINIIGICSSNSFLQYIWRQFNELRKGISDLII